MREMGNFSSQESSIWIKKLILYFFIAIRRQSANEKKNVVSYG
jgi:hypothetical protein